MLTYIEVLGFPEGAAEHIHGAGPDSVYDVFFGNRVPPLDYRQKRQ